MQMSQSNPPEMVKTQKNISRACVVRGADGMESFALVIVLSGFILLIGWLIGRWSDHHGGEGDSTTPTTTTTTNDEVTVTCHFCHGQQNVHTSMTNRFYCQYDHCGQYNGFTEDGDYNVTIPALFHEDLNPPSHCVRRPVVDSSASHVETLNLLCPKCSLAQQQWLTRDRDDGRAPIVCPSCSFNTVEALKAKFRDVQMTYLGATIGECVSFALATPAHVPSSP